MGEKQNYRSCVNSQDLSAFRVLEGESDILVSAKRSLSDVAMAALSECRRQIRGYINSHREFKSALYPIEIKPGAPSIVRMMANAGRTAGVGPMSAVAGAIAEFIGKKLLCRSDEVIVENGGDIFIKSRRKRLVGIYAGDSSPFAGKLRLAIPPEEISIGVCTSSGTVGHSLSFGLADAVTIISNSPALADAAATAVGNLVQSTRDIEKALQFAGGICGVSGAVIIVGDKMGAWGNVTLEENYV